MSESDPEQREEEARLWRQADALFDRLLDLPRDGRLTALAEMEPDPAVKVRVLRLLEADSEQPSVLDQPLLRLPEAAAIDALAGRRLGRWVLEQEIGRGGMAVVYRAHDAEHAGQIAAIKLLTLGAAATGVDRFRREQSILARLNHPHIAPLFDAGAADDGTLWLAMALVDGSRIDDWCRARQLDLQARVRLFLDVCGAVAHAHRHLIVHRDIKPSNVLVDRDGHVRLLDFGIARVLDDTDAEATATRWRALSASYAAPEQFVGGGYSTQTDVFGLGALLYTLLTGQAPRSDVSSDAIVPPSRRVARAASAAATPAALAGDLDAIVLTALATEPAARYPNVEALADDLQRWLQRRPIQARRMSWVESAARTARRHWLPMALAATALMAIGIGALLALERAREARAQAELARAARAEAEDALARATALRDFLIGVFNTQAPGRPRSELPSSAQLLDEGERLALESVAVTAAVRADMLDAITQIRLARGDGPRAEALIERTRALADAMPGDSRELNARALLRSASALGMRSPAAYDQALANLRAAQALLADTPESALSLEIELETARVLLHQRRADQALQVLQPLSWRMDSRDDLSPRLRLGLYTALGIASDAVGAGSDALRYKQRALAETRRLYGERHFLSALAQTNLANQQRAIGDFANAEQQLLQALQIYDEVLEGPSEYRGSARVALGLTHLARGRHEQAILALDQGNAEFARGRGLARPEDYPFYHWNRGLVLAESGRSAEALVALSRAESALSRNLSAYAVPAAVAAGWLAILSCGADQLAQGQVWQERAQAASRSASTIPAHDAALLVEANASCALAAGEPDSAQVQLAPGLLSDSTLPPGWAGATARRQLLAGDIAAARRQQAEAAEHFQLGIARLQQAGLSDHPLHARLRARLAQTHLDTAKSGQPPASR